MLSARERARCHRLPALLVIAAMASAACAPLPPVVYARQERVLDDYVVAQVGEGMGRDQVRTLLGGPARIGRDPLSGQEEWLWRYTRLAIYETCFYVRFDAGGRVSGTATATESERSSFDTFKPC